MPDPSKHAPEVQPTTTVEAAPTGATAAPAPSRGIGATIPWILVALLTGLSVFLGTMLWQTQKDLTEARRAQPSASAPATAAETPAQQPGGQVTAQPTTGERAEQLKKLARRKDGDYMAMGKVDAPITIIEWADYRCPFCAKWALESKPELMPYVDSGSVRIEFRDLPIFGEESMLAHQAARAAGIQGKYWEYYKAVWELHDGQGHPPFSAAKAEELATKVGVADLAKFKTDMSSAAVKQAINADAEEAKTLGLTSTPFFLVGTTPVSGAQPASTFVNLLEQYGAKK